LALVDTALFGGRSSRRDDADHGPSFSKTVAYDEHTEFKAPAEEQEAILAIGVVWIVKLDGTLIMEDGLSFLERYSMLALVGPVLGLVPLEAKHNYMIMLI